MFFSVGLGGIVNEKQVRMEISNLPDGEYEIIPKKKDRTSKQNRYLRGGVYGTISKETGEQDLEYIHFVFWRRFLLDRVSKKEPFIKSTTKLSTTEFTEYVEKIRDFCLQKMNIYIPTPEEREP